MTVDRRALPSKVGQAIVQGSFQDPCAATTSATAFLRVQFASPVTRHKVLTKPRARTLEAGAIQGTTGRAETDLSLMRRMSRC